MTSVVDERILGENLGRYDADRFSMALVDGCFGNEGRD